LTASSLNSAVYELLEIFISCLPKVTSILRHLWKTKFQGKLNVYSTNVMPNLQKIRKC